MHRYLLPVIAAIACQLIMLMADYVLGSKAEFLNAWSLWTKVLGGKPVHGNDLATESLGLAGAFLLMLGINALLGLVITWVIRAVSNSIISKPIAATAIVFLSIIYGPSVKAQEPAITDGFWQIGFGMGELPIGGSFKPSITVGYQFSEKIYTGIIYQLEDEISRDGSSFNVQAAELNGLKSASETVSKRFMFQLRYTPIKKGPYLSGGFVFNGRDVETMHFDNRSRQLSLEDYQGSIEIEQARPAGWGIALGLGYQYDFDNGFSAGFEWTPAWVQYPSPEYEFGGTAALSDKAKAALKKKMDDGFKGSVTNMYKVFHIGVAYRFQ